MSSRYRERLAIAQLRDTVRCVWVQSVAETNHQQRIIPDACIDLIWMNGELSVAGPDTQWRLADLEAGTAIAGIRMRPGAAARLLGSIPASEVANQQVTASDLGIGSAALEDRLAASPHPETELEMFLGASDTVLDRTLTAAIAALDSSATPSVPAIARTIGISERQLRRRVTAGVGYGPKTLQRVLRMERALRIGSQQPAVDVALLAGYADQPHMARDFAQLAGATPGGLLA